MMKIKSVMALTVGAAALLAGIPTAAVADAAPLVTTGATFNDPTDPARQDAVFAHISRLIDGAVPGSSIKVSMYVLGSDWLAGRLSAAHLRGVNVEVLLDSESLKHYAGSGTYGKLADGLAQKTGTSGASWVRVCAEHQACLAKDPNPADGYYGVNHNKFLLFSSTTGSATGTVPVHDVVVQTSANQTAWDRQKAWNDALTVVENPELYSAYAGYFGALTAAQADPSKQTSDYPTEYQAGKAKAYFFPRSDSDVILNILNTVDDPVSGRPACHGNSAGYGTTDGRTVIRIAMHQITRAEVAKKLWELDDAGCYVDIVYRKLDNSGTAIADQLAKPTRFGGITLHKLDDDAEGRTATHSKYLLIEGTYQGLPDQKIVFTGSHPYTVSGLVSNDEALLKYQDAAVHDAYRENFRAQRTAADRQNP
ncbi:MULTISPECIES: phospholipase D-like domain-containing protein [unclassified Streptomyces]|uniref:phospholipase D-like domain-containing protein n=1 Tax=unclassified Streptomyces TaxID=2593676 RepID=UPI002E0F2C52|nr:MULTISPECIES: phospholipase D-like domain-containing protein [unclassified Streptomyces]WSR23715.1 phospholipase D-like domain-containing protein [Streptomyces sp. NBC_01205]